MSARLLIVNNVPTPYRTFLFNRLWIAGRTLGIEVEVAYQAERVAAHAHWDPDRMDHLYPYWFSRYSGRDLGRIRPLFRPWSLTWDVVRASRSKGYRYLLYSPFMSLAGSLVASLPAPKAKRIFWAESNLQSTRYRRGPMAWLKAGLAAGSDAVAVPGERALEYLYTASPALRDRPVLRLPNLVDPALFGERVNALRKASPGPRSILGLPNDRVMILSIGQMEDRKGFGEAIEASLSAPDDFVYCLLGGGSRLEEYRHRVAARGAAERIRLPGPMDESQVLLYLAAADWLWHPALGDPSPLVCVEAIHAGLPLAVSRQTGNAPETVPAGRNGLVFDAASPVAVTQALQTMRETPVLKRQLMGAESIRVATASFDPDLVCRRFLAGMAQL